MWGYRVIIPFKLRQLLLTELHSSHMGATKMKALARSYFWWPHLDENISEISKNCQVCLSYRSDPPKVISGGWPEVLEPMDRIHMDYAGPVFKNKMFLIIIDACSKWPEVYEVIKADTFYTLEKFREFCSRFGIPKCVVTDNGTCFSTSEFSEFCTINGITHLTSPSYHPSSNGLAGNFVKSFKNTLYKMLNDKNNETLQTKLQKFIFYYRNTPHSTTNKVPSSLMLGRKVNIRLEQLFQGWSDRKRNKSWNKQKIVYSENKQFSGNDSVYVRDYSRPNERGWIHAIIQEQLGTYLFLCQTDDGRILKRHIDQIIKAGEFYEAPVLNPNEQQDVSIPTAIFPKTPVSQKTDRNPTPQVPTDTESTQSQIGLISTPKQSELTVNVGNSNGVIQTTPKTSKHVKIDKNNTKTERPVRARKAPDRLTYE
uniref:RNA-directed DNA polymerase n=1 Tax=Lygus hesperus TaxID=30085 RepID=A0A0A9WUM1_LYGHE